MKKRSSRINATFGFCFIIALYTVTIDARTPSFPGAEGGGAQSVGGRGGVVYKVTNLNDDGTGTQADNIGNFYRPGPLNHTDSPHQYEIEVFPESRNKSTMPSGRTSIYVMGNMGPNNLIPVNDNWLMVNKITDENGDVIGPLSTSFRRINPLPNLPIPITVDSAESLENILLTAVGASHRLDCYGKWIPSRDSADQRIIKECYSFEGKIPVIEDEVGGFPCIPD